MAMIAVRVPVDIARLLHALDVPGDKEPPHGFHVTLVHMGDGVPIDVLAATVEAIFPIAQDTQPFTAQVSQISSFPAKDDGVVPIICPVNSTGIRDLWGRLTTALDAAGIEYSKKFPKFSPHATLGYCDDPLVEEIVNGRSFPVVEWGVGEVTLFGGDSGDGTFVASFPFALEPSTRVASRHENARTAAFRALLRLASMKPKAAHDENGVCQPTCPCHDDPNHRVVARYLSARP